MGKKQRHTNISLSGSLVAGNGSPAQETPSTRNASAPGTGTLIIIGGHEDKEGERTILRTVAAHAREGPLIVATLASTVANELWRTYEQVFHALGVARVVHWEVERRLDAVEESTLALFDDAGVIFFTGGDQLKITSKLGGTRLYDRIHEIYAQGGTIAGTSAGASVMGETMLVSGAGRESHKVGHELVLAPGLGLAKNIIIDQHFAQRGRLGRLLGAVAQNPRFLGIGIDEDTAICVEGGQHFTVLGSGAVYVVDGHGSTYTNISEETGDRAMSLFDVRLHVLSCSNTFDLAQRTPQAMTGEAGEARSEAHPYGAEPQ